MVSLLHHNHEGTRHDATRAHGARRKPIEIHREHEPRADLAGRVPRAPS